MSTYVCYDYFSWTLAWLVIVPYLSTCAYCATIQYQINNDWMFRYIRVRYEDLVDDTNATLARIYQHLNLPFTKHVQNVAYARTHAENITGEAG